MNKYNSKKEVDLVKYDPANNIKAIQEIEKDIKEIEENQTSEGKHAHGETKES